MRAFCLALADATVFVLWSAVTLASVGAFCAALVLIIAIALGVL